MTESDRARDFGLMLEKSRTEAGKSRKYMAEKLGKSACDGIDSYSGK